MKKICCLENLPAKATDVNFLLLASEIIMKYRNYMVSAFFFTPAFVYAGLFYAPAFSCACLFYAPVIFCAGLYFMRRPFYAPTIFMRYRNLFYAVTFFYA